VFVSLYVGQRPIATIEALKYADGAAALGHPSLEFGQKRKLIPYSPECEFRIASL
jgi:hypothetical protein